MLTHGASTAWIDIDGVPATEYQAEVGVDSVTCWIASEAGKNFAIQFTSETPFPALYLPVIDGKTYPGLNSRRPGGAQHTIAGVRVSEREKRPLAFAALSLTDEDNALGHSAQDVGEIKLKIYRGTVQSLSEARSHNVKWAQVPENKPFNEKMKKGIDHQTQFGAAKYDPLMPTSFRVKKVGDPIVTFCFKYRPIGVLRANGIAPPPPRTEHENGKRKGQALDDDVIVISDDEDVKPRIHKRKSEPSPEANRKVKREKQGVKKELVDEDVIDLT